MKGREKTMKENELMYIGEIHTPYKTLGECPHNINQKESNCMIVVDEKYVEGLYSLEKGQKILILYWFTGVEREVSISPSCRQDGMYGTFALRTPHRPNPIAVAEVTIEEICGNRIFVKNLDCLDGTKLLDIKPAF